jgi:hypothetical protein
MTQFVHDYALHIRKSVDMALKFIPSNYFYTLDNEKEIDL